MPIFMNILHTDFRYYPSVKQTNDTGRHNRHRAVNEATITIVVPSLFSSLNSPITSLPFLSPDYR